MARESASLASSVSSDEFRIPLIFSQWFLRRVPPPNCHGLAAPTALYRVRVRLRSVSNTLACSSNISPR